MSRSTPESSNASQWTFPVVPIHNQPQSALPQSSDRAVDLEATDLVTGGCVPSHPKAIGPVVLPRNNNDNPAATAGSAERKGKSIGKIAPKTRIWGVDFDRLTMLEAIDLADQVIQQRHPEYFITANLNYLMLTEQHPELLDVNDRCKCMLADGNPIVRRSQWTDNPLPCRVAGADMIVELARLSAEKGYRIFFLGGAPGVADRAALALKERFSQLQIAGTYSPPFRQLSSEENNQMFQRIRDAKTDILLVAFGQPKGELWIYENLESIDVPLSIQLGASFDFLAGTAVRAPEVWQRFGLEWLYRALSDPKRLIPRYGQNALFLAGLLFGDIKEYLLARMRSR
jgi:N-acetylglucosaminyldiphosphoundecaprenol N-acetyl-beta-D-mannosaminyltransferase